MGLKVGRQVVALGFPGRRHSLCISVGCAGSVMILFCICIDHLFRLLGSLGSLALFLMVSSFLCPIWSVSGLGVQRRWVFWGCSPLLVLLLAGRAAILELCWSLVRSGLDYGCIVCDSARGTCFLVLGPVHSRGLGLALGASPVAGLCVGASELSLCSREGGWLSLLCAVGLAAVHRVLLKKLHSRQVVLVCVEGDLRLLDCLAPEFHHSWNLLL